MAAEIRLAVPFKRMAKADVADAVRRQQRCVACAPPTFEGSNLNLSENTNTILPFYPPCSPPLSPPRWPPRSAQPLAPHHP